MPQKWHSFFGFSLKKGEVMARRKEREDKDLSPKTTKTTKQSSDMINERTNNMENTSYPPEEPNVERANDLGLGDIGINDRKGTHYTSNRSADA